jgi:hypothetical protein
VFHDFLVNNRFTKGIIMKFNPSQTPEVLAMEILDSILSSQPNLLSNEGRNPLIDGKQAASIIADLHAGILAYLKGLKNPSRSEI